MNGEATGVLAARPRSTSLALASIVVWLAAAASAGSLGIWRAIGATAVALGIAVLLFDRPASTALLRPSPGLILLGATAGGLMAAATYLLYPPLARISPLIAADAAQLYAALRAAPSLSRTNLGGSPAVGPARPALAATRRVSSLWLLISHRQAGTFRLELSSIAGTARRK